jgi:hypothetical protein
MVARVGFSVVSAFVAAWACGSALGQTSVVRVTPRDARDVMLMGQLSDDCWSHAAGERGAMDWRVSRETLTVLDAAGLAYEMVVADVEGAAAAERARLEGPFEPRAFFDEFRRYEELSAFVSAMVAGRPEIARREPVGLSLEGREIFAVRATSPANGGFEGRKPVIFLNSLQHAREWASVMATVYAMNRFVTEWAEGSADADVLDAYEVVLVPIVNPDGYVYAWDRDRFWRKNRRPNAGGSFGVDLNRNWSYQWGRDEGSSGSATSQTYRGTGPFSEPEAAAVSAYAGSLGPRVVLYWDVHTYGRYILWPWGWTSEPTAAEGLFQAWGNGMSDAMRGSNARYRVGQSYQTLYPTSGAARDYMYGSADSLSWTIELTTGGFVVPPSEIVPTGDEVYRGVAWMARRLCRADYNRDAFVDFFDYVEFVGAFEAGVPRSDFNLDGFVDFFDLTAFAEAFEAGC